MQVERGVETGEVARDRGFGAGKRISTHFEIISVYTVMWIEGEGYFYRINQPVMNNQNYLSFSVVKLPIPAVMDLIGWFPTLTRLIFVPHVIYGGNDLPSLGLTCYVADDEVYLNASIPVNLLYDGMPEVSLYLDPGVYLAFNLVGKDDMNALIGSSTNGALTFTPKINENGRLYYSIVAPPTTSGGNGSTINTNPSPPAPFS